MASGVQGGAEEEAVVATYREIADHWHMASPDQARMKAKRASWPMVPPNHPGDAARVRVPRSAWDGASPVARRGSKATEPRGTEPPLAATIAALQRALTEEQEARSAGAGTAREQLARLEGEMAGLRVALVMAQEAAKVANEEAHAAAQRAVEAEKETAEAQATLTRIRGRGWLARLLLRADD